MIKNEKKIVREFLLQVGDGTVPSWKEFFHGLFDEYERLMIAIFYPDAKRHLIEVYKTCVRSYMKQVENEWEDGHKKMIDARMKLDEVEEHEVF